MNAEQKKEISEKITKILSDNDNKGNHPIFSIRDLTILFHSEISRAEKEWAKSYPTGRINEMKECKLAGAREFAERLNKLCFSESVCYDKLDRDDIKQALAEMEKEKSQ